MPIVDRQKRYKQGPRAEHVIRVRVTSEEKEQIANLASCVNKPVAVLLRELALGYRPASMIDQSTYLKLIDIRGLLGKLGGLLKWYLSPENKQPHDVQLIRNNLDATTVLRDQLDDVADEILKKVTSSS